MSFQSNSVEKDAFCNLNIHHCLTNNQNLMQTDLPALKHHPYLNNWKASMHFTSRWIEQMLCYAYITTTANISLHQIQIKQKDVQCVEKPSNDSPWEVNYRNALRLVNGAQRFVPNNNNYYYSEMMCWPDLSYGQRANYPQFTTANFGLSMFY